MWDVNEQAAGADASLLSRGQRPRNGLVPPRKASIPGLEVVGGSHGVMSEVGLAQKSKGRWVPAPLGFTSCHPLSATHFRDGKTEGKNLPEASQPGYGVEPAGPHSPSLPRAAQVCSMGPSVPQSVPFLDQKACPGSCGHPLMAADLESQARLPQRSRLG